MRDWEARDELIYQQGVTDLRFISSLRLKICRNKKRGKCFLLPSATVQEMEGLRSPHMALACTSKRLEASEHDPFEMVS